MNSLQNRSTLLDKQYDTGQFSACIVTNIGKEMIAKSQNGQTLTFTRVALGDGLIDDDDDILSFTKVKNERLSANIAKWVDKQNGQFQIQFRVSNQEVEIGFWQREIGIMAKMMVVKNNYMHMQLQVIMQIFCMIKQRLLMNV